jgi:hypothetical protein
MDRHGIAPVEAMMWGGVLQLQRALLGVPVTQERPEVPPRRFPAREVRDVE